MERTLHADCGDGIRRADNGSYFVGTAAVAKTANATLSATDTGKAFTNTGAAGTVQITLPAPRPGLWFLFLVTAAQTFEILPAAGGAKINNGVTKISAAGTQVQIGLAEVVCIDGVNWQTFLAGTWTTS